MDRFCISLQGEQAIAMRLIQNYYGGMAECSPQMVINEALLCLAEEKGLMQIGSPYRDVDVYIPGDEK